MRLQEIAPSYQVEKTSTGLVDIDEDARERGVIIHAMLETLTHDSTGTLQSMQAKFNNIDSQKLTLYWQEAQAVIQTFPQFYQPVHYEQAYVEVPVTYSQNGRTVYGIIDRLICYRDKILVIDYKTHRCAPGDNLQQLASPYREQLRLYAEGVRRVFQDKPVNCAILFTALPQSYDLPA